MRENLEFQTRHDMKPQELEKGTEWQRFMVVICIVILVMA